MVDRDRVENLIVAGEAYLADVKRFRDGLDEQRFVADRGEQYRLEFPLQQVIQICLDLSAHLLADAPGHRADTLAGLFDALAERQVIDQPLADRLAAMARFRNLLVHQYADVDAQRVWAMVNNELADIDAFLRHVVQQVRASGTADGD